MGTFTAATLGALLLGAAAADRREDVARPGPETRPGPGASVVGGAVAPPERYPYATPLLAGGGLCGGALIHPRVILTAAHCLPPVPDSVDVGRWDWHTTVEGGAYDTIAVVDDAVHPGWTGIPANNVYDPDFALLLLETPSSMTPVRLAEDEGDVPVGEMATVLGWGSTVPAPPYEVSTKLKEAEIEIAAQDTCGFDEVDGTYPARENTLCGLGIGGDACAGDSGGPLVLPDAGGDPARDVLVGVVSFGPPVCGSWDGYSAYGKVTWGRAWIEATLAGWELALTTDAPTGAPTAGKSGKAEKSGKESGKAGKSTGAPTPSAADTGAPTPSSTGTEAPAPSSTKAKKATKSTKATKTKTTKSRRQ